MIKFSYLQNTIHLLSLSLIIHIIFCKKAIKLNGTIISICSNCISKDLSKHFTIKNNETIYNDNRMLVVELLKYYRITKICFKHNQRDESNYLLGIFDASNNTTFFDALPIYMITKKINRSKLFCTIINQTEKYKYIRYKSPIRTKMNLIDLEIYGIDDNDNDINQYIYQLTNLPLLVFHTINDNKPSVDDLKDTYEDIPPVNKNYRNSIKANFYLIKDNKINLKSSGNILQGSKNSPKMTFEVTFDNPLSILGSKSKSTNYILVSNYEDRTLLRNMISLNISKSLEMTYTPFCNFIDVIMDGEFQGNYLICDQIEVGKGRIDIVKMNRSSIDEPEISGGYHLQIDGLSNLEESLFNSEKGIPICVKEPCYETIKLKQHDYIAQKFNEFESEIYEHNYDKLDLESFSKYFLINEVLGNGQTCWNLNIYKNKSDEHFYFGPIWDMESSLENDEDIYPINQKKDFIYKYGKSAGTTDVFFNKILDIREVNEYIFEKWENMTQKIITKENFNNIIDYYSKLINESQKLDSKKWETVWLQCDKYYEGECNFKNETDFIKNFLFRRINLLNEILIKTKNGPDEPPERSENEEKEKDTGKNIELNITSYCKFYSFGLFMEIFIFIIFLS